MANETEVLVLGASFAGIEVLHQLLRFSEGQPPKVTVIDRMASHGYIPLAQERLCERLPLADSALDTAAYVRSLPGATFIRDEIEAFDPETKTVTLASGECWRARCVVVALGSAAEPPPNFAGSPHVLTYKFGVPFREAKVALQSLLDGAQVPRGVSTGDAGASDGEGSGGEMEPVVAVIGGGVSGVELAGELADLKRRRPTGWRAPQVVLVCSSPRLLPEMDAGVAARCLRSLQAQGVSVRLGARVEAAHEGGLVLRESAERGETQRVELPADLRYWAAGVRPPSILRTLGLPMTEDGWLRVGPTLQCFPDATAQAAEIFACGDAVRIYGGAGRWPTMQRAIECIWQAKVVARNVLAVVRQSADHPQGVPPLRPHRLRRDFFYGISIGRDSLVVYRSWSLNVRGINHAFRRWLMRRYFARYAPLRRLSAPRP